MKPLNKYFFYFHTIFKKAILFLHPVTIEGMESLPQTQVIFAPNHSSNWDPVILIAALPVTSRIHIMAKEELFHIPVLKQLLPKLGAFPVKRGQTDINSIKTSMQVIKNGDNLLIFPEGTTIRNGIGVFDQLPPHAHMGIAKIAVSTGATVIPVFLDGEKKLFKKTKLIFGKPFPLHYTGRHGTAEEMQENATEILNEAYALGGQLPGGALIAKN